MSTATHAASPLTIGHTGPHAPAWDRARTRPGGAAVAGIVAVHAVGVWLLLHLSPGLRERLAEPAPVIVQLFAARPADAPAPPSVPAPPVLRPPVAPPIALPAVDVVAAPPVPAPAPVVAVTPVTAAPLATVPASAPAATPAPPAPPPVAAAPAQIPPTAIAYRVLPDIVYPPLSRRRNEAGLVVVRVLIDGDGVPVEVRVEQSSGFDRLDQAAVAGVRRARFRPYTEDGRARAGWARIPVPFELDALPPR